MELRHLAVTPGEASRPFSEPLVHSIARVGHELRAPLSAIVGLSGLLAAGVYGALSADQGQAIASIATNGEHLLALVDDLLDLAKLEAGVTELQLATLDPAELCAFALQLIAPTASAMGVELTPRFAHGAATIRADRRRATQILVNLLANALRFSPRGGRVGLDLAVAPDGQTVRLAVWDQGPGLTPEQMPLLFRPFVQLGGASERGGGCGLGLALVAQLVRLHGGAVALTSGPGAGSRFCVSLPLQPPCCQLAPARGGPGPLVLIVDEHRPAAEALTCELRREGYSCALTRDVCGAGAVASETPPVALIVAPGLDDHQGHECLRRLREGPLAPMPLLVVGTVVLPDSAERAIGAGATAYLARPILPGVVPAALKALLALPSAPRG